MKTKLTQFTQEIILKASPEELYREIMDSEKHSAFTGAEAIISQEEGGDFSVYGGYAYGKNLKLESGKRIEQSWRAREDQWPEDCMSTIVFTFKKLDEERTKLEFIQKDIPEAVAETFKKGWMDYYWNPLEKKYNK